MKFKNIVSDLLTEASKKDTLINKLAVNDYNAEALADTAGPLSIFFAYKILEMYEQDYYDNYKTTSKERVGNINIKDRMQLVNGSNSFVRERNRLRGIMDWVRVALGGNIKAYQSLTFMELFDESERWHESLGVGDSKIDYKEDNDVVLDFRNSGEGYYWVNLGTSNCPEEAERMGHCGRTRGTIYSLRSFRNIENNHTLNRSHLTASIDDDGSLLQLKGQKNSKPTNEYHKLIMPLFYIKNGDEFLISGIGYEYNSEHDFKFSDLTEDEIKKLYSDRPKLFSGRKETKLLQKIGLIEPTQINYNFTLHISPKYIDDYLKGDLTNIAADILYGDTWQYWDNIEYADWKMSIDYHINEENSQKIIEILKEKNTAPNYLGKFDSGMDLKDMIEEFDKDDDVKIALRVATNDAEAQDYERYLYDELKEALSTFGNVTSMNDEGVTIEVNLEDQISENNIDDETIDEMIERCENGDGVDPECVFTELMGEGWIEKGRFDPDERWYPSIDNNSFNEILNDRLHEIR